MKRRDSPHLATVAFDIILNVVECTTHKSFGSARLMLLMEQGTKEQSSQTIRVQFLHRNRWAYTPVKSLSRERFCTFLNRDFGFIYDTKSTISCKRGLAGLDRQAATSPRNSNPQRTNRKQPTNKAIGGLFKQSTPLIYQFLLIIISKISFKTP